MPARRISKAKSRRGPRSAPVEFELTGLIIGSFCGTIAALVVELATSTPSRLITLAGAMIGVAVGGFVELVGFLRRKRAQRNLHSPPQNLAS